MIDEVDIKRVMPSEEKDPMFLRVYNALDKILTNSTDETFEKVFKTFATVDRMESKGEYEIARRMLGEACEIAMLETGEIRKVQ